MTNNANLPLSGPYVTDGVTRVWSFAGWKVQSADEIVITITDMNGLNPVDITAGYSVDNSSLESYSGSVQYPITPISALPAGSLLFVHRRVPYDQPVAIGNQGAFYPQTHEEAFDYLSMQIQQLAEALTRTLSVNIGLTPPSLDDITAAETFALEAAASATAAALSATAAAGAVARNNASIDAFVGDGVTTDFRLTYDPGTKNNILVNMSGADQLHSQFSLVYISTFPYVRFTVAPPNLVPFEAVYGNAVAVNVPADASVTPGKLSGITTDTIPEGTALFFTAARVRAVVLTGISFATNAAVVAGDTILQAIGKLQAQITALSAAQSYGMTFDGAGATISDGLTRYLGQWASASENDVYLRVARAGTINALFTQCAGAAAGTRVYTLMKNGAATALTVTATGAATQGSDVAHTVAVAAGDLLSVRLVTSGGSTTATHSATIAIAP